ncbi:hypothetical protein O6H91_19G074600 [Diphasiastrum complanatum]|uniref:Uncharacterized protein n=1 Tax=Diphasiastrum complanatum TaxID=34168 RepID=A0ACC2AWL6_DIPCM|nr:hypothetical protein O6H91_19G074600 [Diphasiastrum complanatum]
MDLTHHMRYAVGIAVLSVLCMGSVEMASAPAPAMDCSKETALLLPCLSYVQGLTPMASPACCTGFGAALSDNVLCICGIIAQGAAVPISQGGFNLTIALGLPAVCHINANVNQCSAFPGFPPIGSTGTPVLSPSPMAPSPGASKVPTAASAPASTSPTASSTPPSPMAPMTPSPGTSKVPTAAPAPASTSPTASSTPPTASSTPPTATPSPASPPVASAATTIYPHAAWFAVFITMVSTSLYWLI